jgi:hypothetical protein
MIYIASILTIIVLLVIYSFSDRKRNNEELQFKKNRTLMNKWGYNIWGYSMKTRGIKNV